MQPRKLPDHIYRTYFALRIGLAGLAAILPFVLVTAGLWNGIKFQPSMSAYYFALHEPAMRDFPVRGLFIGILCAIGSFLILYRGFSNTENFLLNAAGACAIGVALVHMGPPKECTDCGAYVISWWPQAHFFFAAALFFCIAWVAWACSEETLGELKDEERQKKYRGLYDLHAAGMLLFPLAALLLTYVMGLRDYLIFALEAFGVWVFAHYWYTKSKEIEESGADKKAISMEVSASPTARLDSVRPQGSRDAEVPTNPTPLKQMRMRAARIFDKEPMTARSALSDR